jgi:hypothetical protein
VSVYPRSQDREYLVGYRIRCREAVIRTCKTICATLSQPQRCSIVLPSQIFTDHDHALTTQIHQIPLAPRPAPRHRILIPLLVPFASLYHRVLSPCLVALERIGPVTRGQGQGACRAVYQI